MDDFDHDRLPALRRLSALLASDRSKDLPAKQFDAYLRQDERRAWRDTLAERLAIKARGLEADLPEEGRAYWDRLRDLYARRGRKRAPQEERAFWNAVEDLWGDFQGLDAQSAFYFEEAAAADPRWGGIPHSLNENFHVIRCGSAFHHWWHNPKGWSQWELASEIVHRLQPSDPVWATPALPSGNSVRALIKRLNR